VGFLNAARPEAPGTLLSHPVANGSATLGRTTTINYVNGWLIIGGEGPGSAEPYDLIKRVYDISNPANPVRRYPLDFGLDYPGNRWIQNTDGWNAHGSAQSGPYLLPLVMRDGKLIVAMEDPTRRDAIDEAEFITQLKVVPTLTKVGTLAYSLGPVYDRFGGESQGACEDGEAKRHVISKKFDQTGSASISTKASTAGASLRLLQAWLVPR
jgi:hypothetical protein